MGLTEIPTITLSGLSDVLKRALRIADNKIALNAGCYLEILQLELSELASLDVDIDPTLTDFSTGEIDVILTSAADPDDEVIPPVPATPRTKLGDVWILGDHRVGCGDGRDAGFLKRAIGNDERIDAAFLEPPYNVKIGGHAVSAIQRELLHPIQQTLPSNQATGLAGAGRSEVSSSKSMSYLTSAKS